MHFALLGDRPRRCLRLKALGPSGLPAPKLDAQRTLAFAPQ